MSDTLDRNHASTVSRGTVLAVWITLVALWVAPYFLPFRGFSRGFVWRNPLSNAVRHADCGLARAPFPDTCADGVKNSDDVTAGGSEGGTGTNESSCRALDSRLAKARAHAGAALIDDLETGDSVSNWFALNDGNGLHFPTPCAIRSALNGERGPNNAWAMHTYGRSAEGFLWAQIGRRLVRSSAPRCDHPIDATGFSGVRFWAKGLGRIRVAVATVVTSGLKEGGTCLQNCYDSHQAAVDLTPVWAEYEIPFAAMVQLGFGPPADFDPSQIMDVYWSAADPPTDFAGLCFDFWIDDVAFYR